MSARSRASPTATIPRCRSTERDRHHLREARPRERELRVHDSINQLARAGAKVLHEEIAPVHVSGHACQEELRTMLSLLRPRYVMPIHGEYRMQAAHAEARPRGGRPGGADHPRRERIGRRGSPAAARGSWTGWMQASRSSTASASATCRTSPSATGGASPTTVSSSWSPRSAPRTVGRSPPRAHRAWARSRRSCSASSVTKPTGSCASSSPNMRPRSSSSRSTSTTRSGRSSTTVRGRRPMVLPVVIEV